ncbi:MAG: beta-ketoacyl-[acyl-carrier-protein] synthase family protein [Acidobacteria bacterium]|nr:beta-ketoacyl-[acyl-carrier-protein] synthase family protein [Acidobacteriota bacterium]
MSTIPVVITGVGPVSAIGCGREPFWKSLVAGQHGFGPVTLCDTSRSPSKIAAEVKDFRLENYIERGRVIARRSPRAVQFALAASVLAMHDAGINLDACDADRMGVYVGTSIGNVADGYALREKWPASTTIAPHMAFYLFTHSAACILSAFFNLRGPMHTISQGCSSGLDAVGQSLRLLQLGLADAMLVVGTDCELDPYIMAILNASGSLSTRYNDEPGRASRPFDLNRDGNVVGEGAAALLLESEPHARARGARIYARVAGYKVCAAGENRKYSHDAPEIDLRPCVRAFEGTMEEAGWRAADVNLVNANGSSSILYDRLEALSLADALGDAFPTTPVHSTKSMLGQHGAGSSALQVVAACLSIHHQTAPPTINHQEPDPACGPIRVVTKSESMSIRNVLVHSIGLGGFYYSCGALTAPNGLSEAAQGQSGSANGGSSIADVDDERPFVPWKAYKDT